MQKLALLFLMAITASMMFSLNAVVFAQNATDTPADEMSTDDTTTDEGSAETTDETTGAQGEMTDDEMSAMEDDANDQMMEETMTETIQSPLQQLMGGTDPHAIVCGDGLQLVFKATTFRPACVKDSSYQILQQRGWASSTEPSAEDLAAMVASLPQKETTDDTTNNDVNMEEDVPVQEGATTGNETNPSPQSYSIDLSESMDMGAN